MKTNPFKLKSFIPKQDVSATLAAVADSVEQGEDLGDGGEEFFRDGFAQFDGAVEFAGQRGPADDRDTVGTGDLLDLFAHIVASFGDDDRCGHSFRLIAQCHRDMRGVDQHDVGLGHILKHTPHGGLKLFLPDLGFDFRGPFRVAVFVFDLLLAHLQSFCMFPFVIQPVANADHSQSHGDLQNRAQNQPADLAEQFIGLRPLQMSQCRNLLLQINPDNDSDENQFENRKQQLDHVLAGKEIFQPGYGVQLFGFEFQGFCGEIKPADQNRRADAGDHQDQQKGTDDHEGVDDFLVDKGGKRMAVIQHRGLAGQAVANLILAPPDKPRPQEGRRPNQGEQCGG